MTSNAAFLNSLQFEKASREKLFIRAEEEMLLSAAGHSALWIPVLLEDQPGFRSAPTPASSAGGAAGLRWRKDEADEKGMKSL